MDDDGKKILGIVESIQVRSERRTLRQCEATRDQCLDAFQCFDFGALVESELACSGTTT